MFRNILDALIEDKATHVINVVVQFGILLWAVAWRGGIKPILAVNFVLSITVLLYNATQLATAIQYQEYPLVGLNLFELAILIASAAKLYGLGVPSWLVWIAFLVNYLICIALMLFVLTFRIDRLI